VVAFAMGLLSGVVFLDLRENCGARSGYPESRPAFLFWHVGRRLYTNTTSSRLPSMSLGFGM